MYDQGIRYTVRETDGLEEQSVYLDAFMAGPAQRFGPTVRECGQSLIQPRAWTKFLTLRSRPYLRRLGRGLLHDGEPRAVTALTEICIVASATPLGVGQNI